MNNVPFEVICTNDKPRYGYCQADWIIRRGNRYEVSMVCEPFKDGEIWYELTVQQGVAYPSLHFRHLEPAYKDDTTEILEKFKPFEGVEIDQPVKELETTN